MPPYKNQLHRVKALKRGQPDDTERLNIIDQKRKERKEGKETKPTVRKTMKRRVIRRVRTKKNPNLKINPVVEEALAPPSEEQFLQTAGHNTDEGDAMIVPCIGTTESDHSQPVPASADNVEMDTESTISAQSDGQSLHCNGVLDSAQSDMPQYNQPISVQERDFVLADVMPSAEPLSPISSHPTVQSYSSTETNSPYLSAEDSPIAIRSFDIDNVNIINGRTQETSSNFHSQARLTPSPQSHSLSLLSSGFLEDATKININRSNKGNTLPPSPDTTNPSASYESELTTSEPTLDPLSDQENTYQKNFKGIIKDGDNLIRHYETPMQRVEIATLRGGHRIITDVTLDVQQMQQMVPNVPTMRIAIAINTTVPPR